MTFDSFSKGELVFKKKKQFKSYFLVNFFWEFGGFWLVYSKAAYAVHTFKKVPKKEKRIWFDPSNFLKYFSKYVNFFQIIVPKIVIANGLKAKEKQIVHVQDLPQCPPT